MSLSVNAINSAVLCGAKAAAPAKAAKVVSAIKADAVSLSGKASKVLNPLKKGVNKVGGYIMKALKAVGNFFKSIAKHVAGWFKKSGKVAK